MGKCTPVAYIFYFVIQTLTKQAHERLAAELEDLTTRGRIEIARVIETARAFGDLKENGDYHAAKDSQGKMEGRIRQIQSLLKDAVIIDDNATFDEVAIGCVVGIRYEGDDEVETFFFGSIEEKRPGMASLSPSSPLGKVLVAKRVGDVVSYQAPGGMLQVEIVAVGS